MSPATHPGDERPPAVVNAAQAADAWRTVVHQQLAATPAHSDFYDLAAEAVDTLRCLSSLCALLRTQVAGYGNGRVLRDDAGRNPAQRLADACAVADLWKGDLDAAERTASRFFSEIGHIAVEVDR